jgi:lysophospholipase L1-like esterase
MLGTNDCLLGRSGLRPYCADLLNIIERIRETGSIPLLQTPPAADLAAMPRMEALGEYVEGLRTVAASQDVVLVDHYNDWLTRGAGVAPIDLLDDEIHPNASGHLVLAGRLLDDLGLLDLQSPTGELIRAARTDRRFLA